MSINLLALVHISDRIMLRDVTSFNKGIDRTRVIEELKASGAFRQPPETSELDIIVELLEDRLENMIFNQGFIN